MTLDTKPTQQQTAKLGPIGLMPGITRMNAYTAVFAAVTMNSMMAFINMLQPIIIDENLGVPTEMQGSISANLTLISELMALSLLGVVGALSDKIGRRPIIVFGFLAFAVGYLLYPLMPNVTSLYFSRAIFAVGVACVAGMMTTILNDYPEEPSRGKMMAVGGVANGAGGLFMAFVLAPLPLWFQNASFSSANATLYTSLVAVVICIVSAIILLWGLSPYKPQQSYQQKQHFLTNLKFGVLAAKKPRIAIAYAAAFVARSDLVVIGTFFLLWCRQAGVEAGLEPAEATAQSGLLFAVMQLSALLSAPLVGIMIDKIDRLAAVAICMGIIAVGYFSLSLLTDPLGFVSYFVAILIGAGMMSGMLSSQALIGENADPGIRGAVIGVFGLSGAIGILFITSVGGDLYDQWMRTAPFLLIAILGAALAVIATIICLRDKNRTQSSNTVKG